MNAKNTGKISPLIVSKSLEKSMYLGLSGIPLETMPTDHTDFLFYDPTGYWSFPNQTIIHSLESQYLLLYELVVTKLWGNAQAYIDAEGSIDAHWKDMLTDTGLNAESTLSKSDFDKTLGKITDVDDKRFLHKYLYTIDFFSLISNIQEISKELIYLSGDFYYILNFESEFLGLSNSEKQMYRTTKSPIANKLIGLMALIYIRLQSSLDYHTKLAYEIEKIKTSFEKYPKLASNNKLYSDKKKLNINESIGTLFEKDAFINGIESYRNELIHNSLLDDTPRIYEKYENYELVERYILLPDTDENGRIEGYVNRNFFYSQEVKFNLILPDLLRTFQERQIKTLQVLSQSMQP